MNRSLHFLLLGAFLPILAAGCSSSETVTPSGDTGVTDAPVDSSADSTADALANTCVPAGGTCIALTATSTCPTGTQTPSDPAIHCEGAGGMCCVPSPHDAGADGDVGNACEAKGGTCIALTATSKCAAGMHSASDPCTGVGSMCCEPDVDAGPDASHD
jgi:hypothetical protein